jgi:hypothetical protein
MRLALNLSATDVDRAWLALVCADHHFNMAGALTQLSAPELPVETPVSIRTQRVI